MLNNKISVQEIEQWLRETDKETLKKLWHAADKARADTVGDAVHLRGLLEISNHCARSCAYCGINAKSNVERYRMSREEIMGCVHDIVSYGYGTIVMQAGEDYGIKADWMADLIRQIKAETSLAVTLSLGERPIEELKLWREAGADRYLIRFETSDEDLYRKIHPPLNLDEKPQQRFDILKQLREFGYEIGSGVMIGIPGQSYQTLAEDIDWFRTLDLDMIGVGPYIESDRTDLGMGTLDLSIAPEDQAPNTELMTYKVIALARLVCSEANIPSTTALATVNTSTGRELGLMRGANVVMPNVTPVKYRAKYELYPGKACIGDTAAACETCMKGRISSIGREIGVGYGSRRRADFGV